MLRTGQAAFVVMASRIQNPVDKESRQDIKATKVRHTTPLRGIRHEKRYILHSSRKKEKNYLPDAFLDAISEDDV